MDKISTTAYSTVSIQKVNQKNVVQQTDYLAIEAPLEIRLRFGKGCNRQQKSIAITMRTPSHDFELAVGFLYTEGILPNKSAIQKIQYLPSDCDLPNTENVVQVDIAPNILIDLNRLERHFYTSSSCGVCGKTSIEAIQVQNFPLLPHYTPQIPKAIIHQLPKILHNQQTVFNLTGGLHATALFNTKGHLILLREDVGRHNAMDKLIGVLCLQNQLPFQSGLVLVSGRLSFELVQKALMAGISVLVAVGAPSSLAVDLAVEHGMTLIGFVRNGRYNVYSGAWRLV